MKPEIVRDRSEWEKKTAAMQEKRDIARRAWIYGHGQRYGDNGDIARYLDDAHPLPVLEEPSPTVKAPSGWVYRMTRRGTDFGLEARSGIDGCQLWNWHLCESDLPAIVLALLGPEKVAEFYLRVCRAAYPTASIYSTDAERIIAAYPKLVSEAGGTHG